MVRSSRPARQQGRLHPTTPNSPSSSRGRFTRTSLAWFLTWAGFVASIIFVSRNFSFSEFSCPEFVTPQISALQQQHHQEETEQIDGHIGILSKKDPSFFRALQTQVDQVSLKDRCHRFGFDMKHPRTGSSAPANRRIFYGALIADEPWELMNIIAAESYGIFSGMVFVESNRTQNFNYRKWAWSEASQHKKNEEKLKDLFGVPQLQIRQWINEEESIRDLSRENLQRAEIFRGWKAMGMTKDDVGYLCDLDETFSREFFRAIQSCPYILQLDYEHHKCDNCIAKLYGTGKVFETSPSCITKDRHWLLPHAVLGACIEEIGDENLHPKAKRGDFLRRAPGHAHTCGPGGPWNSEIPDNKFPLFAPADFRMLAGGRVVYTNNTGVSRTMHSAFHFHNFFANFTKTRFKYHTYGHPSPTAMTDRLEDIQEDLRFMIRCLYNQTDGTTGRGLYNKHPEWQRYNREVGAVLPPMPIYFHDADYVRRKHQVAVRLAKEDERLRRINLHMTPDEIKLDNIRQEQREARRVMEAKNAQAMLLEEHINASKAKM